MNAEKKRAISITVTEEEYNRLNARALACNLKMKDYIIKSCLHSDHISICELAYLLCEMQNLSSMFMEFEDEYGQNCNLILSGIVAVRNLLLTLMRDNDKLINDNEIAKLL